LDKFLLAFGNAPKEVCHTGSIVKTLLNNDYQRKSITEFFLRPLAKPLSKTRLKKLLDFLRTSHERANEDDKTKIIEVFNWYLALMVADNSPKDLSGIHFLNRVGTWKLSSQICLDADGIDPSDLLDKTQAEVLGNFIKISDSPQINRNRANTPGQEINVAEFHKYLRKFEDLVSIRTLGAFLSILGDGDKEHIKNLAKNYLRPENIDLFRDRIDWTPMGTPLETSYQVINENIHAAMAKQRFRFFLSGQNNNHFVHNLLGVFFKARESKDHNTIFLGDFENGNEAGKSDGLRSVSVTLRDIGDEELKRKNAFDLLFESALYLLKRVYGRHPSNLDDLWNEKGEQLDLKVAQEIILKHSVFYFRQLGSKRLTTLKQILNEWEDLETREEQIKIAGSRELSLKHGDIIANQERLRSELRRKLENESDVQSQLLEAVRHKIEEDFQYSEESIAFELFQNADDASRELLQIGGNDCYPKPDIFYMHWDNFRMVFAHSGRAINNQLRNRAFTYEDGVEAGFNRDLEKMLVMSYSDKGDQHWQVTGKFGLGFKSVFIVSKNPKVLSGSLGFEVLAGIYPRRLDQEDRSSLSRVLEDKLDNLNGTVFEIRFSEEFDRSPEEVTKRFRKTLPVLLVFSRQIKQCHLEDASESKITLVNSEREIGYCQGAFIADLHFPFNEEIRVGRVLVLRTGEFGALLLNLGPNGVCGLPEELPTFWNLAPLGSKGLGIAVNGNFRLDVGRAQIAESTERHQEVAQELGQGFGVILNRLYQASETDWQLLKQDLGLAADVTDHQMWESFWKTLGSDLANENSGQNRERDLCKQIFWQTGRGMAKLFESKDAMPSGLHGDYKQLTSLEKIRWCADGRLDSDEKVFKIISSWGTFRSHIPAEGNDLVSKSRIKVKEIRMEQSRH
jgi:hypothetical protein